MKITLDIPNEHAPALLALLSDLMPVRLEPQADPAEGHPELPLKMPVAKWAEKTIAESAAGTVDQQLYRAFMAGAQAGKTRALAFQPFDIAPDDESEAIAETRWAPVATAEEAQSGTEFTRAVTPASLRFAASGIDAADPLKVEMEDVRIFPPKSFWDAPTVPPVVGERFFTREGKIVKVTVKSSLRKGTSTEFEAVADDGQNYYYNSSGKHCAMKCYDLVQQCPF